MQLFTSPRLACFSFAALAATLTSQGARGEILHFAFSGEITKVGSNDNNFLGRLNVGDPFEGVVAFDFAVPDVNPDPDFGNYSQDGLLAVTFPEYVLNYTDRLGIFVRNSSTDEFKVSVDNIFGGLDIFGYGFVLEGPPTVFESDALPTNFDLSDFDSAIFFLSATHIDTSDHFDVDGIITSFSLIPAPGVGIAGALLASIHLLGIRRCRRIDAA